MKRVLHRNLLSRIVSIFMIQRDCKPYLQSNIKKNILNEKLTSPVSHINHDNDVENSDIDYKLYFPFRECQIYVR